MVDVERVQLAGGVPVDGVANASHKVGPQSLVVRRDKVARGRRCDLLGTIRNFSAPVVGAVSPRPELCARSRPDVQFSVQEATMKTMNYTESRARYAEVLDGVANDREEVIITRAGHDPVVIVSLEDYESLRETAYLMRSPANARRLLDAMERLEAGHGEPRDMIDAD
jgi:antitoxin YefM